MASSGWMRKQLSLMTLLACVAISPLDAAETIPLFNGKDLSGWTFDMKADVDPLTVWEVQDGVLVCHGNPVGVMRTKEVYGDYELIIEWRWAPGSEGANSGLLLHASTPRHRDIWPKCLEVQLKSGDAGDLHMLGETIEIPEGEEARGSETHIPNVTDASEKPLGEWNLMRVKVSGDSILVWINGEKVNEGVKASATRGAIGFQSEGTEIQLRKVELTRLD